MNQRDPLPPHVQRQTAPLLFALTGIAWAARSVLSLWSPNYHAPATMLDWLAVVSFSVALLLLSVAIWPFARLVPSTFHVHLTTGLAACASAMAGAANFIEDGLRMNVNAAGTVYAVGAVVAALSLVGLAVAVAAAGRWRLALVPLATAVGFGLVERGGGLIVLAAWGALAVAAWRGRLPRTERT